MEVSILVTLVCPHCENKWEYSGFERKPQCPECKEQVEVRKDIDWETSGSYFAKVYSKK